MSNAHYSCLHCGTELQKGRRGQSWVYVCPRTECQKACSPTVPKAPGDETAHRLLVCLPHGRLFHPPTRAWIPLPDSLRDWAQEQAGHHWIFTAAPGEQCPAAPRGKDAPPRRSQSGQADPAFAEAKEKEAMLSIGAVRGDEDD